MGLGFWGLEIRGVRVWGFRVSGLGDKSKAKPLTITKLGWRVED